MRPYRLLTLALIALILLAGCAGRETTPTTLPAPTAAPPPTVAHAPLNLTAAQATI